MAPRLARVRLVAAAWLLAAAMPALAILPIQSWQAKSGARVVFVQTRNLPMLDVSVEFPAGSAFNAREKAGLAAFTQRLLQLGAGGLSDDDIARRIADVGAQLGGGLDNDRAGISFRTLTSAAELEQTLDVAARVLQRPDFPPPVIERERARLLGAIRESLTRPETLLGRAFSAAIYGDHPYGVPSSGELDTVAKLTREELVDFHRRHYVADRAVVSLIGDITRDQAEAIAERLTGTLPRAGTPLAVPPVTPPAAARQQAIEHPATQAHVVMGLPVLSRDDPDFFPLVVGNHILGGGGFASRINEEVRQKRGLAYSAYSSLAAYRRPGPFAIGLQTQKEQAGEALAVVRETLARFLAEGPTDKELADAKQNLVGGFPLRIDSNRKILDFLAVIGFYGLPLTYLEDYVVRVQQVSTADIRDAFARRVDPARMATVIVGADPASVR